MKEIVTKKESRNRDSFSFFVIQAVLSKIIEYGVEIVDRFRSESMPFR